MGVPFEIRPPPKQKHKFRQTYILPLLSTDKAWILYQVPVVLCVVVEKAQNELICVL